MIFYLTFNEAPSGIFSSQVIDVIKFLNSNLKAEARLLAFISLRGFFENKRKIKKEMPNAIVLPMYPKMENWLKNKFLLSLFCSVYKPEKIMARSVMATKLALLMRGNKCKIIYDGRGAIEAEWKEYKVVTNQKLLNAIHTYEKDAVINSDARIAVSNTLAKFWEETFLYSNLKHVIIPCTLNNNFERIKISQETIRRKRNELGLNENDLVFVYSGTVAGWQSFDLLFSFIEPILKKNSRVKIVFFSPADAGIDKIQKLFPLQVVRKHLSSDLVSEYLLLGDYGLLIREKSVTNKVASPVKYAEYLASGLKVIISEELGDYTQLSREKNWGIIFNEFNDSHLKPGLLEKQKISTEAIHFFSKRNYKEQYQQLLEI